MLNLIFGKKINEHLYATKKIRIKGINFKIKKLNPLHYVEGAKVLKQSFDLYKTNNNKDLLSDKKVIEHLSHVLVYGVDSPKISFKKEDGGVFVDDMFIDIELVFELYNAIMEFTYGKKKLNRLP